MVTKAELAEFLKREFPQNKCTIEAIGPRSATVRHAIGEAELRPGGTVSGPVMMTVADVALAVTTSLNFNFMRKPASDRAIIGVCTMMKIGRSLAVGEVNLYSEGQDEPVAHAVGTYAIPR